MLWSAPAISIFMASLPIVAQDDKATAGDMAMDRINAMKTKIRIQENIRLKGLSCQSTLQ